MGGLRSDTESPLATGIDRQLQPIRFSNPIILGEPRFDLPVPLHVGKPRHGGVFRHEGLPHWVVRKLLRLEGAMLLVHDDNQVDVVHRGHGLAVIQNRIHAFVPYGPGPKLRPVPWHTLCRFDGS